MKQYHATKDLATKMKKGNESLVEAQASVGDLQQGDFEHVERELCAQCLTMAEWCLVAHSSLSSQKQ